MIPLNPVGDAQGLTYAYRIFEVPGIFPQPQPNGPADLLLDARNMVGVAGPYHDPQTVHDKSNHICFIDDSL
jgi:hypothetical protein